MLFDVAMVCLAFAMGGILKGGAGAGAAIVAIPIVAMLYDVQTAVTVFVLPNIFANSMQTFNYREFLLKPLLVAQFVISGGLGAVVGTFFLKELPGDALGLMVAAVTFLYIGFRLFRADWSLDQRMGTRVATPAGFVAGILQGASGISAPISITFLNAMRIERREFVATISLFFLTMGLVQLPLLIYWGLMTIERAGLSVIGMIVMLLFMPIGAALVKRMPDKVFDWVILGMLMVIATRLTYAGITSLLG